MTNIIACYLMLRSIKKFDEVENSLSISLHKSNQLEIIFNNILRRRVDWNLKSSFITEDTMERTSLFN